MRDAWTVFLKELRDAVSPRNVVLVLDSAIGQESVHVAETFHTSKSA